jgi:hypothetical protein
MHVPITRAVASAGIEKRCSGVTGGNAGLVAVASVLSCITGGPVSTIRLG